MSIASQEFVDVVTRKRGGLSLSLKYTLDDSRIFMVGPIRVADITEANLQLLSRASDIIETVKSRDAEEAVILGMTVANKEASRKDVYREWLERGLRESDSLEAYKILSKIAAKIQALGLTRSQIASLLNLSQKEINIVLNRWNYLKDNEAVIVAYKTVVEGDI